MTESVDLDGLPQVLREIAEVAGTPAMLQLAHQVGGTEITLPAPDRLGPDSVLSRLVGLEAAGAICRHFGRGKLAIPLGPTAGQARTRAAIARRLEAGESAVRVARGLHVHERTVRRVRARRRDDEPDLFG